MLLLIILFLLTVQSHCAGKLPQDLNDVERKPQSNSHSANPPRHNQVPHPPEPVSKSSPAWRVHKTHQHVHHQHDNAASSAADALSFSSSFQPSTFSDVENSVSHRNPNNPSSATLMKHGIRRPTRHRYQKALPVSNKIPHLGSRVPNHDLDSKDISFWPYVLQGNNVAPEGPVRQSGFEDGDKYLHVLPTPMETELHDTLGGYRVRREVIPLSASVKSLDTQAGHTIIEPWHWSSNPAGELTHKGKGFESSIDSESLDLHSIGRRSFDSIGNGRMSGLNQNFIKKRPFDSIGRGGLSGINQNHLDKRQMDAPADEQMSLERGSQQEQSETYLDDTTEIGQTGVDRRSFDSIGSGRLSGIYQNHMGKRNFDPINGGRLSGLSQNYLGKRNFDSIGSGRLSGLSQNYFGKRHFDSIGGGRLAGLSQNYLGKRGFDSIGSGRLAGLSQNYLKKRHFDSIGSGRLAGLSQNYLKKRHFDSIGSGRLAGLSQNYLKKRHFDSIGSGRLAGLSQNYFGKRFDSIGGGGLSGLSQNYLGKRNFDSIGSGRLSGLSQNYFGKRIFDPIAGGKLSGLSQNYLGKRNFDSINSGRLSGLSRNHLEKRSFDSIGGGRLAGLSQNYLGKRYFDPIGSGRLAGLSQNYLGKRYFDPIGSGRLAGLSQNYLEKRYFDPIGSGRLAGLSQNYLGKRYFDPIGSGRLAGLSQNYLGKRNFDSIGRGGLSGFHQNHIAKRHVDKLDPHRLSGLFQHHIGKRSFDSIGSGRLAALYQNYIGKRYYDPIGNGMLAGLGQNYIQKRSFDAISYGNGLYGINQNYIDKKLFDRIGGNSGIYGLRQHFVEKKGFDPISRGALSGIHQNYLGGKRFDSISDGSFAGLHQNFIAKRSYDNFDDELPDKSLSDKGNNINDDDEGDETLLDKRLDAISDGALGGMRQNYFDKKYFDSISRGSLSDMRQNFLGKRYFDSIARGHLGGMGQNFISKRFSPYLPDNGNDDSIFTSPKSNFHYTFKSTDDADDLEENLNSKRSFDSISDSRIGGLNQNFVGKRELDFAASGNYKQEIDNSDLGDADASFTPHSLDKRSPELTEPTVDNGLSAFQQNQEKRETKRNLGFKQKYLKFRVKKRVSNPLNLAPNADEYQTSSVDQDTEDIVSRPLFEESYTNLGDDVAEQQHRFSHPSIDDASMKDQDSVDSSDRDIQSLNWGSPSDRYTSGEETYAENYLNKESSLRSRDSNPDISKYKINIELPAAFSGTVTGNSRDKITTADEVNKETKEGKDLETDPVVANNNSHQVSDNVSRIKTEQLTKEKPINNGAQNSADKGSSQSQFSSKPSTEDH